MRQQAAEHSPHRPASLPGDEAPRPSRGNAPIRPTSRVATSLPPGLASDLDEMATRLKRSRADLVRHAIERYLDDLEDLEAAAERLRDPPLNWDRASRELLDLD